jgi:hypothetical protein
VQNWLLENDLSECCAEVFSRLKITGSVLLRLSEDDVYGEEFGIASNVAKKRLLAAIEDLTTANSQVPNAERTPASALVSPTGTVYDLGLEGFR